MTDADYSRWVTHTAALLPIRDPKHAEAWFRAARPMIDPHSLSAAASAVTRVSLAGPGFQSDWLGKINAELRKAAHESEQRRIDEMSASLDPIGRSECVVCGSNGIVELPHRETVSQSGQWLKVARTSIYCECATGRKRLSIDLGNDLAIRSKAEAEGKRSPTLAVRITTNDYTAWLMQHTGMDDVAARDWWYPIPYRKGSKAMIPRQDLERIRAREAEQEAKSIERHARTGTMDAGQMVAELKRRFSVVA